LKSGNQKKDTAHHGNELSLADLFKITSRSLEEEGAFYFLLPYKRKEEILGLLKSNSLFIHEMISIRQSESHGYFRLIVVGGRKNLPMEEKEIAIKDLNDQYTASFTSLLKDYYLHI